MKKWKRAIAAVWIMAIVGLIWNNAKQGEEDVKILNIPVEVTDAQYLAIQKRVQRMNRENETNWTADEEIRLTAAAAVIEIADAEIRRQQDALADAKMEGIPSDTPIRVVSAHEETGEPTLSDDPAGEPEAATENNDQVADDKLVHADITELDLLMRCVQAEAGNQPIEGKQACAEVIRNRVNDPRFPDTIFGVITEPGQFSVYKNGSIWNVIPDDDTKKAVEAALAGSSVLPADYVFFNNRPIGSDVIQIKDHYFGR